jgi:hypothetical protein
VQIQVIKKKTPKYINFFSLVAKIKISPIIGSRIQNKNPDISITELSGMLK